MAETVGAEEPGRRSRGRCRRGDGGRRPGGGGSSRRAGPECLDVREDVRAGDATAETGADDPRPQEPLLPQEASDGRRHATGRGAARDEGRSRCGCRGHGRRRSRRGPGGRRGRHAHRRHDRRLRPRRGGRGWTRGGLVGGRDDREVGAVGHRGALGDEDLGEDALVRRRHLRVHLVRDDLEERLVLHHAVARLLQPPADGPLRDALAELGHRHLGHAFILLARSWAPGRRTSCVDPRPSCRERQCRSDRADIRVGPGDAVDGRGSTRARGDRQKLIERPSTAMAASARTSAFVG